MSQQLNQTIASLRKEKGLTQEQLGQLVGVSAQAVSKWEKGGTPDVELLPILADTLGVTLDTLFGRSADKREDISQTLIRWLDGTPDEDRFSRLFSLLVGSFAHLCSMEPTLSDIVHPLSTVLSSCYTTDGTWLRSRVSLEKGMAIGVFSEDFPLYLLLPEPPAGYASQFAPTEDYRALFSVLSREGALELLYYLYSHENTFYTVTALSDRTHLSLEQLTPILEDMERCHLVRKNTIVIQAGPEPVYALSDNGGLVPFLYLARWFIEKDYAWYLQWNDRKRPWLVPGDFPAPNPKPQEPSLPVCLAHDLRAPEKEK